VHPHLFGVAGWLPFAPAVLEIADQLFFFLQSTEIAGWPRCWKARVWSLR